MENKEKEQPIYKEQPGIEFKSVEPVLEPQEKPVADAVAPPIVAPADDEPITYDFEQGELIVPNDDLRNAFFFEQLMQLNPHIHYRRANSAEFIYYNKNIRGQRTEISTFDKYKSDNNKKAMDAFSEVEKSRQKFNF